MKKVLLSVAPVCHENVEIPDGIKNPVLSEDIARDVLDCAELGVSMVHLHVRDKSGKQTSDLSYFSETIDLIRKESDIVIQGSTGGVVELSLDERCVSLNDPRVEVASLNMGSSNLNEGVYINTLPDIRYWAERMQERNIIPEMEIFDLSMIDSAVKIFQEGLVKPPFSFNFCLGFENSIRAKPDNLFFLKQALPDNCHWGLIHDGMEDMALLITAAGMGATSLRFGFEDSFYYKKGKLAESNKQLAEYFLNMLDLLGFEPMSPSEARDLIGVRMPSF
jgi:3-keto-5-aminohexanoate cleavage enzyme